MLEIDDRVKKGDQQTRFSVLEPHLEKTLTEDVKPQITYAVNEFRKFEGFTRVRTNISKMEKWLPYLYWKEGLVDKPDETKHYGEKGERASIFGQELHGADVLFNLITQGTVGPVIKRGLPSANQETLDVYYGATEWVETKKDIDEERLLTIMAESWERFLNIRQKQERDKKEILPMFQDMGFSNPLLKADVLGSNELFEEGLLLAEHWTSQYFKGEKGKWGYGLKHESVNEVLAIVNTELLQIMGRVDRITREERAKKTVTVQITDLKTGNRETEGELQQEIRKRQAQLALFMTERFAARYILDKKWLNHSGGAFPVKTSVLNNATEGRAKFFFRWFDKGEVEWEEVTMNNEERDEFLGWLIWYSTKAQEHREELKKLR
jgi:hypothetical protein